MLMLLQTRGRMRAQELAAELEVSVRTIYRDITALSTAGVPVYAVRGPGGGVSLVERYRSDLTGLNKDEVQALFMLSIPPALSDLGLDQELKAALRKLSAALPGTLRGDERRVRERIYIDPRPWDQARPENVPPHLHVVQRALWDNRVLFVRYHAMVGQWIGPLEAKICPYGLVAKGGNWYLVGLRRDHLAVFRVDYLLEAEIQNEACQRPADFDLVNFWEMWCQQTSENHPYFPVTVRADPRVLAALKNLFGEDIQAQIDQTGQTDSNGWIRLELPFEYHELALERLLPFGGSIEVLDPVALRYSIRDYAEQILAVYSGRDREEFG
jgi:predicted DNA-binding transcriptional regulator YafY